MVGSRSRYGLLVSAVGALALGASLLVPWYRVALASAHVTAAGGSPASRAAVAIDAFHALPAMSVILLVLCGLALVDVTAPVVRTRGPLPGGAGGSVVLLGLIAAGWTLYRMLALPTLGGGAEAVSLQDGAWLALAGSLAMVVGGMWPRYLPAGASIFDDDASPEGEHRPIQPGTLSWS